jgi:hypothetical protein
MILVTGATGHGARRRLQVGVTRPRRGRAIEAATATNIRHITFTSIVDAYAMQLCKQGLVRRISPNIKPALINGHQEFEG